MSQLHLRPPEQFDFRNPDDWSRWKRRFEQFRVASGLTQDSADKQISTLLYCLGEQAEAVLTSTNITAEERKIYDTVIAKLDEFFKVRKNVIFERARFNRRNQLEGESAEHYIMALYDLAANCEYGDMQSEMIRDRLVVGIQDTALSERLQMDADLTLEKAKKTIRQREAVQEQQRELKGSETKSLDALKGSNRIGNRRPRNNAGRGKSGNYKTRNSPTTPPKTCTRCGKDPHPRDKCPAKDAECYRCRKKGHYGALCLSKAASAHSLEADLTCVDTAFLDNLSPAHQETAWLTHIQLNGKQTPFKIDTGAEVTAISRKTHKSLGSPTLDTPSKILYGPSKQPLQVLGSFRGTFNHRDIESTQQVFVVEELKVTC